MIINQMGGGSGGEVWKHYTKTITDKYVSGNWRNWSLPIGKYNEVLICGTVYFLKSNGTVDTRGKFCSWFSDNVDMDLDIYLIDKVTSSGTKTATCGYFDVTRDVNMNAIIDLTMQHSPLVSDAVTVKIAIDAFSR